MKVERAVLREIRLRLRDPFRTSRGVVHGRRVVLVTLFADGIEGWGECVAGVDASSLETADGAWRTLEEGLLPRVIGREVTGPIEPTVDLVTTAADEPIARAALEMALWDLAARSQGVSLSRMLGGTQASVPVGVSIGLQSTDEHLTDVVAEHLANGYARVKVKIEPGRDVDMLTPVRERFPGARLWADANGAYSIADIVRLRQIDALGLELIEQPLAADDLAGHARLQSGIATPVCLDESITSADAAKRALELGACRVLNIKPARLGGHAEAIGVHDLCRAAGVPVWCGGMLESGIGRAHNLALASLPGFTLPGDISASRRYWDRDIIDPAAEVVNGSIAVPSGPGIGVAVDEDYVRTLTVRQAVVE
jgi:O-succinylbenzoate synthase